MTLEEIGSPLDEISRLEEELSEARHHLRIASKQRDEAVDGYRDTLNKLHAVRRLVA